MKYILFLLYVCCNQLFGLTVPIDRHKFAAIEIVDLKGSYQIYLKINELRSGPFVCIDSKNLNIVTNGFYYLNNLIYVNRWKYYNGELSEIERFTSFYVSDEILLNRKILYSNNGIHQSSFYLDYYKPFREMFLPDIYLIKSKFDATKLQSVIHHRFVFDILSSDSLNTFYFFGIPKKFFVTFEKETTDKIGHYNYFLLMYPCVDEIVCEDLLKIQRINYELFTKLEQVQMISLSILYLPRLTPWLEWLNIQSVKLIW
jgi:hypothetical protein